MKTLTSPADLATKRPYAAPVYLLKIDFTAPSAKTLRFSDRFTVALNQEWLPFVTSWGTLEDALNSVDVDGRPATAEVTLLNTKPIEGKPRLSDLIFIPPLNTTGTYQWAFAKATVYQLFEGLGSGDEVLLSTFYLEEPTDIGEETVTLRMSDESLVVEDRLSQRLITASDFPDAPAEAIGKSIPVPFGILTNVSVIPVVDSATSRLASSLLAAGTSLTLEDASGFPASGTVQIDAEHLSYTGKSGQTLTGLTRGVNTTTGADHQDGAQVYEVRSGTQAYRYAVGEHIGNFKIKVVLNVTVNGTTPAVSPAIQLEVTDLVAGRNFALLSFPTGAKLWKSSAATAERNVAVSTISVTMNGGATASQTRTVSPSSGGGTTSTDRIINARVVRSGNLVGTVNYWRIKRRLSGGSDVEVASGSFQPTGTGGTQNVADTRVYDSTADEIVTFEYQYNNTNDGLLELIFDLYKVIDHSTVLVGGGPTSIGAIACDVEGIQDDASGTISGTVNLLLENPADVTKFILLQLLNVASANLGGTWATTRTALLNASYIWAFLLEFEKFSALRRRLGEQARSALYLDGGLWQFLYLADLPSAVLTLDYLKDVAQDGPASLRRTTRTDIRNSLTVSAKRDYAAGRFRYVTIVEDLTQVGLTTRVPAALDLDLVQDPITASRLGSFWLDRWKRQYFEVDALAWWNALSLEKFDHVRIANHPVLSAYGGADLLFRIVGKSYLLGDAHNGRIRLHAIEAVTVPVPTTTPLGEDDMIATLSRLTYISATSIQLGIGSIPLKVGGVWSARAITSAITISNSGLAATTTYFVYAVDNAGATALELSTTGHVTDATFGVEIKSGDATRTLVGMIRTQGSTPGQFVDSPSQRFVASYFNRRLVPGLNGFTASRTTTSTTFVELNTEIRIEFASWGDALLITGGGESSNSGANNTNTHSIGLDGTTAEDYVIQSQAYTATADLTPPAMAHSLTPTEGYHFITLLGKVSAGTGTWIGAAAGAGALRCTLNILLWA